MKADDVGDLDLGHVHVLLVQAPVEVSEGKGGTGGRAGGHAGAGEVGQGVRFENSSTRLFLWAGRQGKIKHRIQ